MFNNIPLSAIAFGGIFLLNACAAQHDASITPSTMTPANCQTARRDMVNLQNENASVAEKTIDGVKTVRPFQAVVSILGGDYDVKTPVSVEQYTLDMKSKMSQIITACADR